MGRIVISENVSLDGVIQDPAGVEGFRLGGWVGHTLMEHDLVDELRLMIYPLVLGAGERLFGEITDRKPMRLVSTRTVDDLALLTYETVRDPGAC